MEKKYVKEYEGDVLLYSGDISRKGYELLSNLLEEKSNKNNKSKNVCLTLSTLGGDPNAAYRMARALNHHYPKNVAVLVPGECKSAGTLLCIGAGTLIIGNRGELGPLDIQLSKPDEMFENMSGLDIIQAISALKSEALRSFRDHLVNIRSQTRLRTKFAAEIASKLTEAVINPIASKIDPMTLGEHNRAIEIALEYGSRLDDQVGRSLRPGALNKLVAGYPAHSFVIDRKEAATLFEKVLKPEQAKLDKFCTFLRIVGVLNPHINEPMVQDLSHIGTQEEKQDETHEESGTTKLEALSEPN